MSISFFVPELIFGSPVTQWKTTGYSLLNYRFITSKTKMMANFKSNLIIVCYFKGENESLGHL